MTQATDLDRFAELLASDRYNLPTVAAKLGWSMNRANDTLRAMHDDAFGPVGQPLSGERVLPEDHAA
jgi:hypothetical protein